MKRPISILPLAVAVIFPFISVQACGPFFSEDVFVRKLGADHPPDFAAGKLGVLLSTYTRADLTMAYRYLSGGVLSPEEQKANLSGDASSARTNEVETEEKGAANPTYYNEPAGPADNWLEARARYATSSAEVHPVKQFNVVYRAGYFLAGAYENCQADAFRSAVSTLESRAKTWGARSPELTEWIMGQDAVFSNCGGPRDYFPAEQKPAIHPTAPLDLPAQAQLLLRQDRAYQKAAAQFYATQFAVSRAGFEAIAQDSSSPWHDIARYLVARTLIREAFLSVKNDSNEGMSDFNPDLMKQAEDELKSMRQEQLRGISPHAVEGLLNLVRLRTEPAARLREISSALAGPAADPDYKQDLVDLNWYLNNKLDSTAIRQDFGYEESSNRNLSEFEKAYEDATKLGSAAPLIDWLITFQSPSGAAKKHALLQWQHDRSSLPWLVAALAKAAAEDPQSGSLIEAAAKVPSSSPAWATVEYHRIRLMIESDRSAEARMELEADSPRVKETGSESAVNLFTGLRMRTGTTLDEALADAPRRILERNSQQQMALNECIEVSQDPKRKYDCKEDKSPVEFSADAVDIFNKAMPLETLAQAAQSKMLPRALKQDVAIMTWVRAVLLGNEKIAAQMIPLLPQKLQQQAGIGVGFHQQVAILRNPGLRPFLDAGVQRSAAWDFVESYGDNWWCRNWSNVADPNALPASAHSAAFLTPVLRTAGERESAGLLALGSAEEYLGAQVLDHARMHPDDADIPEALYLTLRMIRYGCYHASSDESYKPNDRVPSIAREVGLLMRQRYANNPWTKRAAPFVWPAKKDG